MSGNSFNRRRAASLNHSRSQGRSSRRRGLAGWGLRTLYDLAAPNPGGSAGQGFFNAVWTGIVVGTGLVGALIGMALLGPIGALLGLVGGVRLLKK